MIRILTAFLVAFWMVGASRAQVAWERLGPGSQYSWASPVFDVPNQRFLAVDGNPIQIKQWNGASWQTVATAPYQLTSVSYRACFDTVRNRVVIVGPQVNGIQGICILEWDGANWTLRNPANLLVGASPYGSVVWDPVRQRTLILGNLGYEWDGTILTNLGAPPNSSYGLTWNALSGRPLLPGSPCNELLPNNTWAAMPMTVQAAHMGLTFHDAVSNKVHSMPPSGWSYQQEEWDGTQWRTVNAGTVDPGGWLTLSSVAQNPSTNEILGVNDNGTYRLVRGQVGTVTSVGTGCPGALGIPTLSNPTTYYPPVPVLGKSIAFVAGNILPYPYGITYYVLGFSTTQWNGLPLPLDTSVFGMPGCRLYQSIDAFLPTTGNGLTMAIPRQAGLLGTTFHAQVMGLELIGVNGPGTCMSHSSACTIGVGW